MFQESQVAALRDFVQQLTEESHQQLPGSKVLWYDSVTRTGELKWQDQLNEENWYTSEWPVFDLLALFQDKILLHGF